MNKVLTIIVVAILIILTTGCTNRPYYRPGDFQWRVNCETRYTTPGERTACSVGQAEKDAEIEKRREQAAYRKGRGSDWRRNGRYGVNSYYGSILRTWR